MVKKSINIKLFLGMILGVILTTGEITLAQHQISLEGQWQVKLDRDDVGIEEKWYSKPLTDGHTMQLPGSLQENDIGDKLSVDTEWTATWYDQFFELEKYAPYRKADNFKIPFWLTSDTHYIGASWFQKEVEVPEDWRDKRITLELERSHWGSMVFVNDQQMGADSSLATPHRYDLTEALSPGKHTLTVRVDNRYLYEIGKNSHSISDHTQSNWNGLVGDLNLEATSPVFISDAQIYPDIKKKVAVVKIEVGNITGHRQSGHIKLQATPANTSKGDSLPVLEENFTVSDSESGMIELTYSMGEDPLLWDEFNPHFYTMRIELDSGTSNIDSTTEDFGMRRFSVKDSRFQINGKTVFLRGTLESAIFPKTGYPSTSKKDWIHIFTVAKQHGLNHIRFHSWCPPKAAFEAADEVGIYLQPEASVWANQGATLGDGKPVDRFVIEESKRIMKEYGNHPSFVMFAHGNEPGGQNYEEYLADFVTMWKERDNRRLYTAGTGWPPIEENDFHVHSDPRIQQWEEELDSEINSNPPSTNWNFAGDLEPFDGPVVGHENGQWTVYPNFKEMSKYTGVLYPHNFEIFRDFLEKNHMLHQAHDFLMASGKLQALCYKADIEAALRTPDYAGYQMLDLHDFPGQGTALVGILDPFWDSKPYINSDEFSRFSSRTVPLAKMEKRILANNETFTADLEIAHFAEQEQKDVPVRWIITKDNSNQVLASGERRIDLPIGNNIEAGRAMLDLASFEEPQKLNLNVTVGEVGENDWDFWVYPERVDTEPSSDIIITKTLTPDIERKLKEGAKVLLQLNDKLKEGTGKEVVGGFSTIFWNTAWTSGQAPHTMGVLVEPTDPLFHSFPTEYHTNWQWWDIVYDVHPMILNDFPAGIKPKIQMIDTWFEARKLGLMFEAKVGKGKLMVTSIDFEHELDNRLAARQLYYSLLGYMSSEKFDPEVSVNPERIRSLYN